MRFLRTLKVLYYLLTSAGPVMRGGRQMDQIFRFYVLKILQDEGLFDYLQVKRTYGQILTEFGYVDSEYTREVLNTLATDTHNIIQHEQNTYWRNEAQALPTLEALMQHIDTRLHSFTMLADGTTRTIPDRMRNKPVELVDSFEQDGRQLLTKFDKVLGARVYSGMRRAAFSFLLPEERAWLKGKTLLDIGCGSGREPAELWLLLDGDVAITAVEPAASMIELAQKSFPTWLNELNPGHPQLNQNNTPTFRQGSATKLPFPDNSFDAAFWLFILHWVPDPRQAVHECVRVVKPGGVIFGAQAFKPEINPYFDLVVRTNENCHGGFWREDYRRWFAEVGVKIDITTAAGVFRATVPK
ncbi:MAG: class I SAM-dependent methyltransferase [Chloroflexota bacterium]